MTDNSSQSERALEHVTEQRTTRVPRSHSSGVKQGPIARTHPHCRTHPPLRTCARQSIHTHTTRSTDCAYKQVLVSSSSSPSRISRHRRHCEVSRPRLAVECSLPGMAQHSVARSHRSIREIFPRGVPYHAFTGHTRRCRGCFYYSGLAARPRAFHLGTCLV